jgi:hypothetical protein
MNAIPSLCLVLCLAAGCSTEPPAAPAARESAGAPEQARPGPEPALSPEGREAFRILRDAERFTDDAIYYAGITPVEVRAFRWLMREPEAGPAFAQLAREATLPGRLYALCGLYYTDPAAFTKAVEPYRASEQTVFFQTGCIGIRDQAVAELVESPGSHPVRLTSRSETVKEWASRNAPEGGYRLDILGGGYPSEFRDAGGWHAVRLEPLDEPAAR